MIRSIENSRRGQLETLEPILIVIMLVLIAGIGLLFYVNISAGEYRGDLARIDDAQAIAIMQRATSMPELSCALSETAGTFCLDKYKVLAFSSIAREEQARIYYQDVFGTSSVRIGWLEAGSEEKVVLYNITTGNGSITTMHTYFTLHDPVADERYFAVMTIAREAG